MSDWFFEIFSDDADYNRVDPVLDGILAFVVTILVILVAGFIGIVIV